MFPPLSSSLIPNEDVDVEFAAFLAGEGIAHHVVGMRGTKKESIPLPTMKAILNILLDARNLPVLVHCKHGRVGNSCFVLATTTIAAATIAEALI